MAQHTPYCRSNRWFMILIVSSIVLLIGAYFHPIWYTSMEAPQYPETSVSVSVYPGYLSGDIQEVDKLGQYIGVHLPRNMMELQFLPWIMGAIVFLLALLLWTHPGRYRRIVAGSAMSLFVLLLVGGLIDLQYRLYVMGHNRTANPPLVGIGDFTPPALGLIKVGNFNATMLIGTGGWMMLGSLLLLTAALYVEFILTPEELKRTNGDEFESGTKGSDGSAENLSTDGRPSEPNTEESSKIPQSEM